MPFTSFTSLIDPYGSSGSNDRSPLGVGTEPAFSTGSITLDTSTQTFGRVEDRLSFTLELRDTTGAPIRTRNGNEIPKLIFRVNPTNMSTSYKKVVSRELTLGGWVEYHGGDELDTITITGATGLMYIPDLGTIVDVSRIYTDAEGNENTIPGRTDSQVKAFTFLEKIIGYFKSNGCLYDARGMIYQRGQVYLTYDNAVYKGLIETLSVTEVADEPYSHQYNMTFIIENSIYKFSKKITDNHRKWSPVKDNAK